MIKNKAGDIPVGRFFIPILMLISMIIITGCDLLVPTQTLPPTATMTQTTTPTPTIDWFPATPTPTFIPRSSPTPQPTREGMMEGLTELVITDDFTDESLWETTQAQSGNVAFGVENLTLAVARPSTSLFSLSEHEIPESFALEITLQPTLCEPNDQVGIIFWYQSNNDFHRLLITCGGQIRLELVQGSQSYVLHDWEQAAQMALASPASNRLSLWVNDGKFQLFINDVFQFEEGVVSDLSGGLGVFARTISGDAMTVRFSNLEIYRVE